MVYSAAGFHFSPPLSIGTCNLTSHFLIFCADWLLYLVQCIYVNFFGASSTPLFVQEQYFSPSLSLKDIDASVCHRLSYNNDWYYLVWYVLGRLNCGLYIGFHDTSKRWSVFCKSGVKHFFDRQLYESLFFWGEFQQRVDCDLWCSVVSRTDGKMVWINICQPHRWYSHAVSISWSPIPLKQKLIIPSL